MLVYASEVDILYVLVYVSEVGMLYMLVYGSEVDMSRFDFGEAFIFQTFNHNCYLHYDIHRSHHHHHHHFC